MATDSYNVKVAVRCRPSNINGQENQSIINCDSENEILKIQTDKGPKHYAFDKVFGLDSTQKEIFDSIVRPIIDEILSGFNCTILAYGQTGMS
jgi:kinesin family protein 11